MFNTIIKLFQSIPAWYLILGLIIGVWFFLDFLSNCYDKRSFAKFGNLVYFYIGLIGIILITVDMFLWPIYVLCKISERFWIFRGNIKF